MKQISLLRNFSYLSIGKISGDLLSYILFVYISRAYSIEGAGQYSFAFALTGFFSILAEFGLHSIVVKELGRKNSDISTLYSRYFSARTLLTCVSFTALLLIVPFLPFSNDTKWIICLIGAYRLIYTLTDGFVSVFIAKGETLIVALLEISLRAAATLLAVLMIAVGGSISLTLAMLPLVGIIQFIVAYRLLIRKYGKPTIKFSYSEISSTLKDCLPYATSNFLQLVTSRIDLVLLGFILGAIAAGIYNAAYRLFLLILVFSYLAELVLLPIASKLFVESINNFQKFYEKSLGAVVLIGIPLSVGIWLIAEDIIILIYGKEFQESIIVLRILSVSILLVFTSRALGIFLMASDLQAQKARSHWIATIFNLISNIVLIPTYGVLGAAVVTVFTEILLVILFVSNMNPIIGIPDLRKKSFIAVLGAFLFSSIFNSFPNLSLFVVIPGSIIIFGITLVLFKETRNLEVISVITKYIKQ